MLNIWWGLFLIGNIINSEIFWVLKFFRLLILKILGLNMLVRLNNIGFLLFEFMWWWKMFWLLNLNFNVNSIGSSVVFEIGLFFGVFIFNIKILGLIDDLVVFGVFLVLLLFDLLVLKFLLLKLVLVVLLVLKLICIWLLLKFGFLCFFIGVLFCLLCVKCCGCLFFLWILLDEIDFLGVFKLKLVIFFLFLVGGCVVLVFFFSVGLI